MSKKKHFFHIIILIFLCSCSHAHAELSLYLGGGYVGGHVMYGIGDPIPALGIHSDNYAQWNGHVLSTVMSLSNGRADSSKVPFGNIVPYQQPSGYQMSTGSTPDVGIQFEADIGYQNQFHTLITLWDDASTYEVPVDTLYIWHAAGPGYSWAYVTADAGGPYQLAPGQSVTFDATDSTVTMYFEDIPGGFQLIQNVSANKSLPFWSINGVDIAFGLTPEISYETLIGGLGLEPGIYELELNLREYWADDDIATTTIQIIPEPAVLLLLGLGALILRKRRRP